MRLVFFCFRVPYTGEYYRFSLQIANFDSYVMYYGVLAI